MELSLKAESGNCLFEVKRLHEVPAFINQCCDLINMEWKRSHTARRMSIESSSENFPMSLVLLKVSTKREVVGHCKVSKLSMSCSKVFVETVVIHPDLRGKGLGKFLMNAVEILCKSKNIRWIYLSTEGQEGFYEKLGYTKCAPVSKYGCQFNDSTEDLSKTEEKRAVVNSSSNTCPPPPPPPPMPKISPQIVSTNNFLNSESELSRENEFPPWYVVALDFVNGACLSRVVEMRDYTTNSYCDFLWVSDLLRLKKNGDNVFTAEFRENQNTGSVVISNVIIFGTIIEVKQIGNKGYLYQIDDGTGVIACKHSQEQFQEVINLIESEQYDNLNETLECQQSFERSALSDVSANDSVFNDRSIQVDEMNAIKRGRLKGIQSIWDDLYISFNSLIEEYCIGDSVIIHGKLYNYFNINQIYINSIRAMDIADEIMQLEIKLEDSPNDYNNKENLKKLSNAEKRLSGLVTFDNIQQLNPTFSVPGNIETAGVENKIEDEVGVVTPNLETMITFDTFPSKM